MGKYKPYPAYKDSGVEWLGDVPEGWGTTYLKHVSHINMGQSPNSNDCNIDGLGVPFLQGNGEFKSIHPIPKQYCFVANKYAQVGDILFSVRAPVGAMNMADQVYGIGRGLCAVTTTGVRRFLWWIIAAGKVCFEAEATGSTFEAVSAEQVRNLVVPNLGHDEQTQIAAFLDHETAKIDLLIEKQEKLVELLKEKRQAVISHAVTKGLDPDVEMKDSGVEWLGEVPAHWGVKKGKYLYKEQNRPVRCTDGVVTSYRDGEVTLRTNRRADGYTLAIKEVGYQGVRVGDLVVQSMDAFAGAIGVSDSEGKCSPEYIVCQPANDEAVCDYHAPLLRLMAQRDYIFVICPSVRERAPRFRYSKFSNTKMIAPPAIEQKKIVDHIAGECKKIDSLIKLSRGQTVLLKERRTALISAAVTGKIDVRDWKAKNKGAN